MSNKKELWLIICLLIVIVFITASINEKLGNNQVQAGMPNLKIYSHNPTHNTYKIERVEGNGNAFGDMAKICNLTQPKNGEI